MALLLPGSEGWSGAVARGDRLASEHRLLSAVGRYEEAARHPGGESLAWTRLGRTYLSRGQGLEAADAFRRTDAARASSREVLLGLASALDLLGDVRSSLAALRRELELRPGDGEAWLRLADRAARAGFRPGEVRELLAGAPSPDLGSAHGRKAAYLLGAGVLGAGSEEGRAALRLAASGADPGLRSLAAELLEAAEAKGVAASSGGGIARVLLAQGLVGPALASLEELERVRPLNAEGLALKGHALARAGLPDGAEEALRRSLEIAPENPIAEFLLGSFLRQRGDAEGAARLLGRAARRTPGNPAIYAELANALIDLGDYGSAEQALTLAVRAAPDSADLRLAVAAFRVDRQYRAEESIEDAGAAVRLSRRSPAALGALGWALHLAGRTLEALAPLQEAVARDPGSPALRYRLGSVYEALGDRERARQEYLMVAELDGLGEHWRRARAAFED